MKFFRRDQAPKSGLATGAKMADGSVFAGLTADGTQQIYAMSKDLDACMTFTTAEGVVQRLNGNKFLGHDDWHIPAWDTLKVLQKNHAEGALRGSFTNKAGKGPDYPQWYWSSTEHPGDLTLRRFVDFSDGDGGWYRKEGIRLSCRLVRLEKVAAPTP